MKTEDFNRLKEICEKEGFETTYISGNVFVIKKDPWEGVEFAEVVKEIGNNCYVGQICKLSLLNNCGRKIWIENGFIKPSTEEAYIKQLKKTAYEKFGEIKEGDVFKCFSGNNFVLSGHSHTCGNLQWDYDKLEDVFFYYHIPLYEKGKWATKLPEKVEVDVPFANYHKGMNRLTVNFDISSNEIDRRKEVDEISKFLAKQLENYLNNEQGS